MSQRDIADTIEEIYGFEISHETISTITDRVIETANELLINIYVELQKLKYQKISHLINKKTVDSP